jgi:UDP-N-acetylglucosamine--N-acetylmuramyl-(pentapeptide) pyrophosphoryl-undecaprenol N-acetylglucosamine transferase
MELPSILVPYPYAADNHQFLNASSFCKNGACQIIPEEELASSLPALLPAVLGNRKGLAEMRVAASQWHHPQAARQIANAMLQAMEAKFPFSRDARLSIGRGEREAIGVFMTGEAGI